MHTQHPYVGLTIRRRDFKFQISEFRSFQRAMKRGRFATLHLSDRNITGSATNPSHKLVHTGIIQSWCFDCVPRRFSKHDQEINGKRIPSSKNIVQHRRFEETVIYGQMEGVLERIYTFELNITAEFGFGDV
ncbi:LOW QUALITY PROTEIN: hypothetical protein BC938DRAFT_471781 [Jimgerdemannia flammicorona]|uniref:Uncharacterized protein n=1 Tax=Jimgerdemannia flammicorona TaxID=994334 RepID=A0A433QUF6_9FUNG|nr:LOW QUALITY PROTEIN: hypothetical protein BC938DRAFT_471781 [Jimgerdemannia flammicorona]